MKLLTKEEAENVFCPVSNKHFCVNESCMAWEYKTEWVEHEIKGIPKMKLTR